ncbi:hypothetical protein AMS68_001870 [Peltaster fructicola]|uniref:Xaa-Pro aminopeptidase n=1 Tax=Peltaster fructicola TaxID=286661 RepID=A0A6H0XNQ7_9PEZI|nr:hypothetical protein AMS68_001870 [Peltaster fructicola]
MDSLEITIRTTGGVAKYPAKAHARRVAEKTGLSEGIIGMQGTNTRFFSNSDQPQPFRQDRYFYYMSGCDEPSCFLVYDIGKDILTLYLPPVDYTRFYYDGRGSTIDEAMEKYDIDRAAYQVSARTWWSFQKKFVLPGTKVLAADGPSVDDILRRALDACRSVKDADEIELIRKANQISSIAHKDVLLQLHNCKSEAEAEAIYMRTCIARRAKAQAYGPIFGAGSNASQLHYIENVASFGDSQLLLVDAGCEWQRYASDVTRTIPINRKNPGEWPSKEAKQVYDAVEEIQEKCIKLMRVGTKFSFVALTAQHLAVDALLSLGILKGTHDEIWKAETNRAFFPHGLGHHLGLEVHDVSPPLRLLSQEQERKESQKQERWWRRQQRKQQKHEFIPPFDWGDHGRPYHARRRRTNLLTHISVPGEPAMEEGNVITIEPGLYFNEVVLRKFFLSKDKQRKHIDADVLKRFMPVGGVRIEDDILITSEGPVNLTTAPKGKEMLEILRKQG